jgi:hypothetical protein
MRGQPTSEHVWARFLPSRAIAQRILAGTDREHATCRALSTRVMATWSEWFDEDAPDTEPSAIHTLLLITYTITNHAQPFVGRTSEWTCMQRPLSIRQVCPRLGCMHDIRTVQYTFLKSLEDGRGTKTKMTSQHSVSYLVDACPWKRGEWRARCHTSG